jgi:cell division protein FtsB
MCFDSGMDEQAAVATPRSRRGLGFTLVIFGLVVYFGYFAIYGKHGLVNWVRLQQEISLKQGELDRVRTERAALEHRVRLLRPESVDPDLLEEQARARLGLSQPDEVVILKDKK